MADDHIKRTFEKFMNKAKEIGERDGLDLEALPSNLTIHPDDLVEEIHVDSTLEKPTVALIGSCGNAFSVLGTVRRALVEFYGPDLGEEIAKEYQEKAMSGDYNHLLRVTMDYVEITQVG